MTVPGRGAIENRHRERKSEFLSTCRAAFIGSFYHRGKLGRSDRKRSVGDWDWGRKAFLRHAACRGRSDLRLLRKTIWAAFLSSFLSLRHTSKLLRKAARKNFSVPILN